MPNLVIVAIPREDDPVWKYSSEKKPHCTLLFLGENQSKANEIAAFLQHAVSVWDRGPFGLSVDRRDTLGEDEADVLFFRNDWSTKELASFRSTLLKDNNIRDAYDSVEQFPGWNPHLTMGYPSTPAKKDDRDYPGFHWVEFDRIALWTGDFEGPEFRLEYNYDMPMEVMMSAQNQKIMDDLFLEHFGVKGMKWGQRKRDQDHSTSDRGAAAVTTLVKKDARLSRNSPLRRQTRIIAKGGERHDAAADAIKVEMHKRKLKKSGVDAMTTMELRELTDRLRLEDAAMQLTKSKGKTAVKKTLGKNALQIAKEQAKKKKQG